LFHALLEVVSNHFLHSFFFLVTILQTARIEEEKAAEEVMSTANQTTKDELLN
jgi:hypothetical protein